MKLYATTTSERGKPAHKGGNEYVTTRIADENDRAVYHITIMPHYEGHLIIEHHNSSAGVQKRHGGGYFVPYDEALDMFEKIRANRNA